ncbi:MAG TPA: response regulator [Ktedonobacteraceae bacterium]|nr:response regulator [Ktedonobacteraceae bacterium]
MSNTFDKLSVLDSFIEEVNSYLPEIETNLKRLTQSSEDMEALEETYRRTHTIGGSASMMDFPGLSHVAHGMEDILGDVLENVATLDTPTLEFLERGLQRLYRLVKGIRNGIDDNAVIAEDDADYTHYREEVEMLARGYQNGALGDEQIASTPQIVTTSPEPSLEEMLASFRTPVPDGDELEWPEESLLTTSNADVEQALLPREDDTRPTPSVQVPFEQNSIDQSVVLPEDVPQSSAEDYVADNDENGDDATFVASSTTDADEVTLASAPPAPVIEAPKEAEDASQLPWSSELMTGWEEVETRAVAPTQEPGSMAQLYAEIQERTRHVEDQATTLKRTLTQLRLAASMIETQRVEFKGFLDGSKDALERMEDWAGRAMGLNLRNSPEQVKRYLPLSVMWVANNKLKKVLDLLKQMASNVELTDEQMREGLEQLRASIEASGVLLAQGNASNPFFANESGWTPWEARVAQDEESLRERVMFERRGDMASLRSEIEARLREELSREYESRPVTRAARAELEQLIRDEVRQEFEAKRRLHESVSGLDGRESLLEIEARLRNEIEIEVRQQFLDQLTGEALSGGAVPTLSGQSPATQYLPTEQVGLPRQVSIPPVPLVQPAPTLPQPMSDSPLSSAGDFNQEAAEIFRQEAEEHLQTISMYVAQLEHTPDDREPIQGIRRATHTLKGAAGMMGFRAIADLSHISEDLLDSVVEGAIPISPTVLSLILDTAEALDMLVNGRSKAGESEAALHALRLRYAGLLGEQSIQAKAVEEELAEELEASEAALLEESAIKSVSDGRQEGVTMQQLARSDLSVRVPLTKLDELVNLFGELLVNRSVLEERLQRLVRLVADVGVSSNRLRDVGQKLESRFEAATLPSGRSVQVMPGQGNQNGYVNGKNGAGRVEPAHLADFDELELDRYTEFHQLARGLSEGISDMTTLSNEMDAIIRDCEGVFGRESRLNTTFQDRLMKARLVPLSTMIPRLYRTARAVALKQHKEFEFALEGQETEVDRTVIEEIAGPLLHLIRNAVNHAIETPEMRSQQGKSPAGQIKLSAAYEGNLVVITVRDDGTGIDPMRVRNAALARGLIKPEQNLSEGDIIELIFRPGFSTAEVLSEESGRGVGLDVVRDSVSRLRGTLEVDSTPGQGTAFTMKFPTSLAIQNAMMVNVGDQQYAIPTVMVEAIGRMDTFKPAMFAGRPAILVQNEIYALAMLSQLLGLPTNSPDEKAPIVLVHTDRHRVALVVDSIRGRMDVVMKNLGPHLRHVHGIAGGTVLGNGRVVLILEMVELLTPRQGASSAAASPAAPRRETPPPAIAATVQASLMRSDGAAVPTGRSTTTVNPPAQKSSAPPGGKHILVVDDSPSVRRVVGNMLKQNGWEVQLARDGVEALEMITRETPAAVLLDIEMPRMDGYELMATVRAQEQYRTLPLVMLTSRAAAKHQQRAMQLGASGYVVKPYQDDELLNILKSLVYGATV